MIVQYYKPNAKNTGCAFSFDIGANNKNQEPCVYIRAVKQYSWNSKTRSGSFSENAKNPEKSISIKLNEIEIGDRATIKDYANDLLINTQAKGVAAKTIGLRAVAFNFETINGKIYIAGVSSKQEQIEKLIDALKSIKGVKEIINYVIIKE